MGVIPETQIGEPAILEEVVCHCQIKNDKPSKFALHSNVVISITIPSPKKESRKITL